MDVSETSAVESMSSMTGSMQRGAVRSISLEGDLVQLCIVSEEIRERRGNRKRLRGVLRSSIAIVAKSYVHPNVLFKTSRWVGRPFLFIAAPQSRGMM
jgi:hypothetical protein